MDEPKIRKRYVETSRGLVHLQDCGSGDRTLAVLSLTSFGGVIVDRLLPSLARRGWHVLALDLMGYGRSDRRDTAWRVEDFADNVEEALSELGVAPVALVCGHFSSWTGIEIAGRHRPSLRALVLDGTPRFDAVRRAAGLAAPTPAPIAWTADGSHAVDYWKRAYGIVSRLDPGSALPEGGRVPSARFREACLAVLESLAFEPGTMDAANRFEIERKLAEVNVPVLLTCGEGDWNFAHHAGLLADLANARERRFTGMHPLHDLERPERAIEYADVVCDFLEATLRPAGSTP